MRRGLRAVTEDELGDRPPSVEGIDLLEFAQMVMEGGEDEARRVEIDIGDGDVVSVELTDQLAREMQAIVRTPSPPRRRRLAKKKKRRESLSPRRRKRLKSMR